MTAPRQTIEERLAAAEAEAAEAETRRIYGHGDFLYDQVQNKFWARDTGVLLEATAVNASIPLSDWRVEVNTEAPDPEEPRGPGRPRARERRVLPTQDIMRIENNLLVEGSTWWPGHPPVIEDVSVTADGFEPREGLRLYNTWRPGPERAGGVAANAAFWTNHVRSVFPDPVDHEYFFDYAAHLVQRPEEKCNAAIILSGKQGVGKDAILEPLKRILGAQNVKNIDPDAVFGNFTGFVKCQLLVVDEIRPHDADHKATAFYEVMKKYIASPPATLPMNEKNQKPVAVVNIMRVVFTTNDHNALHIPADDRRLFLMFSPLDKTWAGAGYFRDYFAAIEAGGWRDVAAWLGVRDISAFNPKEAPPQNEAKAAAIDSWDAGDDGVAEALDDLGWPQVLFTRELMVWAAGKELYERDMDTLLKGARRLMYRLSKSGYEPIQHEREGTRWDFSSPDRKVNIKAKTVFVRSSAVAGLSMSAKRELVKAKGRLLVAGRADLKVVKTPSVGDAPPASGAVDVEAF